MTNDTFIGNWNLYMGSYDKDYKVTVQTTTATIEDEQRGDGRLTFKLPTGLKASMNPHSSSGFSELIGSSPGFPLAGNAIFLILAKDGKTFHGAVKDSPDGSPQVWWGERQ
jgi:hypothetical protein